MKTVGEILKTARLEKGIKLEEAAAETKIKTVYLEAIEKDEYQKLPSEVSARGFIKNYAEFLGLSSRSVLAIFKRDFKLPTRKEIIPRGMTKPFGRLGLGWSPKITLVLLVAVFFFILFSYLGYQYFSLIKNPGLEIVQPKEGEEVSEERVEVVGKADPDSVVTVNGSLVSLSSRGEFSFNLNILPGENKIVVEATNRLGKKTRLERTVFYKASFDIE